MKHAFVGRRFRALAHESTTRAFNAKSTNAPATRAPLLPPLSATNPVMRQAMPACLCIMCCVFYIYSRRINTTQHTTLANAKRTNAQKHIQSAANEMFHVSGREIFLLIVYVYICSYASTIRFFYPAAAQSRPTAIRSVQKLTLLSVTLSHQTL